MKEVVFCGVDEVAEIAYLSLRETELTLVAVYDDTVVGHDFFGMEILSLADWARIGDRAVVLTSLKRGDNLRVALILLGVAADKILIAGSTGMHRNREEAA